tara:strand:- start:1436 stop:5224 length:3789 start_codon:yes stop_codon:yes gene_type:complete
MAKNDKPKKTEKKKKDDKKLPMDKVVNYCVFMSAVNVFLEHIIELSKEAEKDDVAKAQYKEAKPLINRAKLLLRRFKDEIQEAVETFAVCEAEPGGGRLKAHLNRARSRPISQPQYKAKFLAEALRFMSTRQSLRTKLVGTGKVNQICRRIGSLPDDPTEAMLELVSIPPIGGVRVTRQWVKEVADWMKVSGTAEERVADIQEAQNIAKTIKDIDAKLKVLPPASDEAKELQAERSTKMDKLMKVAKETGDEQAALGAATAMIYSNTSFATETGKQLGLTEEQEDAMTVTGQALIAAGAGSGKTRVLAGKVVDIIKREGGKSNQIIATSFSKKSSLELKDRVEKYGGAGILDSGDKGFATTHSIALAALRSVKPELNKKQTLLGGNLTALISTAMKQVEMRPNNARAFEKSFSNIESTKGFFDGLFESKVEEVVEHTESSEEDAPLQLLLEEVGKSSFDWDARGKEVGQKLLEIAPYVNWSDGCESYGEKLSQGKWMSKATKKAPTPKQLKWIKQFLEEGSRRSIRRRANVDPVLSFALNSIWETAYKGIELGHKWAKEDMPVIEGILYHDHFDTLSDTDEQVLTKLIAMKRYAREIPEDDVQYVNVRIAKKKFQGWADSPANQWFNIGDTWFDDDGRAIGAKRVTLMIDKYRANLISPSQAWANAKAEGKENLKFAAAYGAYMWLKENDREAKGFMDFTDQQEMLVKEMIANPQILKAMQNQYKWILVDEAQDLNKLQHLLFGLIAGAIDPETQEYKADGSMTAKTFCFIGDDKQAIYEFRGATPDEFTEKSDRRDGQFQTKVITSNFRSGKQIVDSANKLIAHNEKQIPMVCSTNPERGQGQIEWQEFTDYQDAANETAAEIEALIETEGWSQDPPSFGIACRTNAEAMSFGVELIKRKIPFRSKFNFFNDPLTTGIVGWFQVAVSSGNKNAINRAVLNAHKNPSFFLDEEFNRLLKKKAKGQNYLTWLTENWDSVYEDKTVNGRRIQLAWRNKKNVKPYVDTLNSIVGAAEGKSAADMFQAVIDIKGVSGKSILEFAIETVKKDGKKMDQLWEEADGGEVTEDAIQALAFAPLKPLMSLLNASEDLPDALAYIEELQTTAEKVGAYKDVDQNGGMKDRKKDAVNIDTCHGWKGLEAIHMWVPMVEGVFPNPMSDVSSERRLAYVALTRGRDTVKVLCPQENHRGQPTEGLSPFIGEACIPQAGGDDFSIDETEGQEKQASTKIADEWLRTVDTEADFKQSELDSDGLLSNYGSLLEVGV